MPEADLAETNGQSSLPLEQAWQNIVNACSLAPLNLGQQQLLQASIQQVAQALQAQPKRRAAPK